LDSLVGFAVSGYIATALLYSIIKKLITPSDIKLYKT
jgi:hypothetical protein